MGSSSTDDFYVTLMSMDSTQGSIENTSSVFSNVLNKNLNLNSNYVVSLSEITIPGIKNVTENNNRIFFSHVMDRSKKIQKDKSRKRTADDLGEETTLSFYVEIPTGSYENVLHLVNTINVHVKDISKTINSDFFIIRCK